MFLKVNNCKNARGTTVVCRNCSPLAGGSVGAYIFYILGFVEKFITWLEVKNLLTLFRSFNFLSLLSLLSFFVFIEFIEVFDFIDFIECMSLLRL